MCNPSCLFESIPCHIDVGYKIRLQLGDFLRYFRVFVEETLHLWCDHIWLLHWVDVRSCWCSCISVRGKIDSAKAFTPVENVNEVLVWFNVDRIPFDSQREGNVVVSSGEFCMYKRTFKEVDVANWFVDCRSWYHR